MKHKPLDWRRCIAFSVSQLLVCAEGSGFTHLSMCIQPLCAVWLYTIIYNFCFWTLVAAVFPLKEEYGAEKPNIRI